MSEELPQAVPGEDGAFTQPPSVSGSQESSVQALPSLQFGAAPPTQTSSAQVSLVVHSLPSSQGPVLGVWPQPV
ncbi:hypothetical protein D3C83_86870 [compost metagenome]